MSGIIGKKVRMTQIFTEDGTVIPVTVVQAGPCYVTQVKTVDADGYAAVQVGFEEKKEKNTPKPLQGHFKKAGVNNLRYIREFPLREGENLKPGDQLGVDQFSVGDTVVVTGTSKGKGFQGVMKRHGFSGANKTHGQSDRWRAPGSLGQSSWPSRVFKGLKMAGRTGNRRVTLPSARIAQIDTERNLLFITGALPGSVNSVLEIKKI